MASIAASPAQPAQSYEQVKAALWNRDGARVIAVADGAVIPQLPQRLSEAITGGWDCLRRGQLPPEVADRSAFLAELERQSPFTDFLLRDATRDFPNWGVVLVANRGLMEVRNHCRALLEVLTPDGDRRQWRWYDPELLTMLLPALLPSQLDAMFDPLHELVLPTTRAWTWFRMESGMLAQQVRPMLPQAA